MWSRKQRNEQSARNQLIESVSSADSARLYGTQATAEVWRAVDWRILRECVAMSGGIRAIYIFSRRRSPETLTICPLVFLLLN
jgi:hypothetical protein